jgi:hypothetical protein
MPRAKVRARLQCPGLRPEQTHDDGLGLNEEDGEEKVLGYVSARQSDEHTRGVKL